VPRKRPPYVELWRDRYGKVRVYFRKDKGPRIPLPDTIGSEAFNEAYNAALLGEPLTPVRPTAGRATVGSLASLILSYKKSKAYVDLRDTTKTGYNGRLETLRREHGHRTVQGLTKERIEVAILNPYSDRPGAQLAALKMLRVLIKHSMRLEKGNILRLMADPSAGIARPKSKEIRAWTDAELLAFERRWPIGTKQRTAYALMRYTGAARTDVHLMTWAQVDQGEVAYTRNKTGVAIDSVVHPELRRVLDSWKRGHVCILTTAYGKPFTVDGFSGWMRDAIRAAGLPMGCRPHGLRKTLGKQLAEDGATAHEIMAVLGHKTLEEAERYTREADRKRGAREAIHKLRGQKTNKSAQTTISSLGKRSKNHGKTK
jgi:integrase